MRDWVNELTGGDGSSPGLRIPSEAEIVQVSAMFPNVGRGTVVGALQRRYVPDPLFSSTTLCSTPRDPMWVVELVLYFSFSHLPSPICNFVVFVRDR